MQVLEYESRRSARYVDRCETGTGGRASNHSINAGEHSVKLPLLKAGSQYPHHEVIAHIVSVFDHYKPTITPKSVLDCDSRQQDLNGKAISGPRFLSLVYFGIAISRS
jgi:hypothetical protein